MEAETAVIFSKENATTFRGQVTVLVIASRRRETKVVSSKLTLQKEKPLKRKKSQT